MAAQPAIRELQQAVVREVVAVAQAAGPAAAAGRGAAAMERIATAMPAQLSSTAQDMARGKPTRDRPPERHTSRAAAPNSASPRR
jgi:2-dehydropantoate 2-reductase